MEIIQKSQFFSFQHIKFYTFQYFSNFKSKSIPFNSLKKKHHENLHKPPTIFLYSNLITINLHKTTKFCIFVFFGLCWCFVLVWFGLVWFGLVWFVLVLFGFCVCFCFCFCFYCVEIRLNTWLTRAKSNSTLRNKTKQTKPKSKLFIKQKLQNQNQNQKCEFEIYNIYFEFINQKIFFKFFGFLNFCLYLKRQN